MDIYGLLSLVVITSFYSIYVVKQVVMHRRGVDTARLGKGTKPRSVAVQERILAMVTVVLGIVQYTTVLYGGRWVSIVSPLASLQLAGIVISSVGTLYFLAAVNSMRSNWRAGIDSTQDTSLVQTGIYRFSRNPAFVGFDLLYIGFALVWPTGPVILLSVIALVLFHLQILREEDYLKERFGEEYLVYKRRTLRY